MNVDDIFGEFVRNYKKSKYRNNTIIILTADHAMYPGSQYKNLFDDIFEPKYYDKVPLVIYDPTHILPKELDLISSQVDILPSILHLLDINIPNPFEGLSLFDEEGRKKHPNIMGSQDTYGFYKFNNEEHHFNLFDIQCSDESETDTGSKNGHLFTKCDFLSLWRYKKMVIKDNHYWHNN